MRTLPLLLCAVLVACSGDDDTDTDTEPTDTSTGSDTATTPVEPAPRCAPVATLPTDHIVEGDTWEVTWACAGTVAPQSAFVPTLVEAPAGVDFDPATWTASATTDLDDAGTVELFLSVSHSELQGVPETLTVELHITDAGPGVAGNTPVDPLDYAWEFGLPVIHITPAGPVTDTLSDAVVVVGGEEQPNAQIATIEPRPVAFPKDSYTLRSDEVDAFDADDLGLGRRKGLTLLTTFPDNSYVRQKLSFDLWEALADHFETDVPTGTTTLADTTERPAPHASFVVVYLDGAYHGLYIAVDHIDGEYWADFGLDELGNVYRSISPDANFSRQLADGQPKADLFAGWEKAAGLPEWYTEDLEGLTAFVADSDPATFYSEADTHMVVDQFMDWWLLVAFASAGDSTAENAWLYSTLGDERFQFTPWGFDHSWGQDGFTVRTPVEAFDPYTDDNRVFSHLLAEPSASIVVQARYASATATGGPLSADALTGLLDLYIATIEPSARRDQAMYGDDYAATFTQPQRPTTTDLDGEWAYLRSWLEARPAEVAASVPF